MPSAINKNFKDLTTAQLSAEHFIKLSWPDHIQLRAGPRQCKSGGGAFAVFRLRTNSPVMADQPAQVQVFSDCLKAHFALDSMKKRVRFAMTLA